jgi:hypothetical protein
MPLDREKIETIKRRAQESSLPWATETVLALVAYIETQRDRAQMIEGALRELHGAMVEAEQATGQLHNAAKVAAE